MADVERIRRVAQPIQAPSPAHHALPVGQHEERTRKQDEDRLDLHDEEEPGVEGEEGTALESFEAGDEEDHLDIAV